MFNTINLGTVLSLPLSISLALSSQFIEENELLLKWEIFWGEGQEKDDEHLQ